MDPNYGLFYEKSVKSFYVAWRRTIRKLWALSNTTHCRYLHTINNSLPIDFMLEKRCVKFIWSCINSNNTIVKSVSSLAIMYSYSSLGENYRFLSDKCYVFRKCYDYTIYKIQDTRYKILYFRQIVHST